MSGFELEHQSVSDKFERNQRAFQSSKDDSNRALLESLKHSSNIAQDLASLYSERPYVYARVMKQLTGVLGAARVRRLHTTVQENARQQAAAQRAELEKANRKSLHKDNANSAGSDSAGEVSGASAEAAGKEYNINFLGLSTKVKLSSENGTHSIECSEWNIPYLKSIQGTAKIDNADLTEVKLDAELDAKHLKKTKVKFGLKKVKGKWEPSGDFSTDVEIPGIDSLSVGFKFVKEGETTSLEGSFATDATLFKSVTVGASGKVALNNGNTSIDGTLTAKGIGGAKKAAKAGGDLGGMKAPASAGAPAAQGAGAGAGAGAVAAPKLNMGGTVNLKVTDGKFDAISGELKICGLGFVSDPNSGVTFNIKHSGDDFEAKMSACELKPIKIPGSNATIALTVNEASYTSENQFAAKAHIEANLWDSVMAVGDVDFENNKLQAASLVIAADNFSIPGQKAGKGAGGAAAKGGSFLTGSLMGTIGISDTGFEKANVTGNVNLKAAGKEIGINLNSIDIDSKGAVKGAVSLGKPLELGCATLMSCDADFDTATDAVLTKLEGNVKVDHPNLKSQDPGLAFNYANGELEASGDVKILQGKGTEIATSQLTMKLNAESLSATCDVQIENDFPIPDASSKLKILAGATANLKIADNEILPLKFAGDYKYGDAQEGGEKSKGKGKSSGPLAFSGTIEDGSYDLNTGAFNGTVSAVLESDVSISGGCATLTLPQKRYEATNQLTVTFADSKPTTATGQLTGEVDLALKSGKDGNLRSYVTAKIDNFDFDKGEYTGKVMAKLIENYEFYKSEKMTIVLQGKRECGLNLTVAANTITDMDLDAASKVTVPNENVTQGKVVFDADFKNIKLDLSSLALQSGNAAATLDGDVEMNAHDGATHVTVKDKSGITLDVNDGEVTSFTLDAEYNGSTSALHTQTDIVFKGSAGVKVAKKDKGYVLDGQTNIEVTEPCILDAIEGMDKITLEKKTKFGLKFSEEGLKQVTGDFYLDYDYVEPSKYIPNGFGAKLSGTGIVCDIGEKTKVSGKFKLAPNKNIDVNLAPDTEAAKVEFTLLKSGTGMVADLKNSKLKKLGGSANFTAKAGLTGTQNNAELGIDNGKANFGFDVETGDLEKLTVTADVNFNADLVGGMVSIKAENMKATADFDKSGITTSTFNGKADLDIKRKSGDPLHMELSGDLKYSREKNFDGKVGLTCKKETKLGDFPHKGKTFEYGLGQAKGPAAKVDAEIKAGSVSSVEGSVGVFLRQTGEDDLGLLKIHGDVNFKYDCDADKLVKAEGKVSIEEKTLFVSNGGEKLVLKPSEATVTFADNKFVGVKGSVNLALADKDSDYLLFSTNGDFDCLGDKKFTGNVNAKFCRDKKLGNKTAGGYQFVMGEGGQFNCDITENKIGTIDGSFNFKVQENDADLFKGEVSGKYVPATEGGAESKLNAKGKIKLLKDMPIDKEGKFLLGEGSEGGAEIIDNKLQQIDGKLIVIINGPKTADGKANSKITVTAQGVVDLEKGEVAHFEGKANLSGGAFEIASGLSLTRLDASVSIENNKLQKIAGGAGIKYENKGFTVTGDADLEWEKAANEGEDKIGFNGKLSVTAFENKIYGEVGIDYKSYVNNGAPTINGMLHFKITDWLGGEIGLKFGEKGWEDPIVFGKMEVTDVELVAARKLFSFGKDLGTEIPIFTGVTLGVGVGLGLSLNMEAIKFGGTIEVQDYHVKSPKGIPDFKTTLNCSTGLNLKAGVKPYVSLGIGFPMFSAGIKVKGGAEFVTTATAGINGELHGGEQGLGGEFGLGVQVKGEFIASVTPSFYANALGMNFNKDIHTWEFNLGELFNFTWGKKIVWDKSGTRLEDGAKAEPMQPKKVETAGENKKGGMESYKSDGKDGGKGKEGAPSIPGADTLGGNLLGNKANKPEDAGDGTGKKIEQAMKIAKALGTIGKLVGLISGIISSAAVAGPLGPVVFIAIKIITGELKLSDFTEGVKNVKEGIEAIKELLAGTDLLKSIMPEWAYKIYDFLRNNDINQIKKKVLETLREKFKSYGSPLNELLQPVLKFIGDRFDYVAKILELFKNPSVGNIVKGIFMILGFSFTSIKAIIDMVGDIVDIFKVLVKDNIKKGNIYIYYKSCTFIDDYWWRFCIPGLIDKSGSTEKDGDVEACLISKGLLLLFGGCGLKKVPKK